MCRWEHEDELAPHRYRAALNAALATEQVDVVASILEELAARSGLAAALGEKLLHMHGTGLFDRLALEYMLPCRASWHGLFDRRKTPHRTQSDFHCQFGM